jgi:ABC-type uncharacterized transport system substrate-binding protein
VRRREHEASNEWTQRKDMKKKIIVLALSAMFFALCGSVGAQQPGKIKVVGYLAAAPPPAVSSRFNGFRQQLHALGYVEGKHIVIEARYAQGKLEHLPALAGELVSLSVDVILSSGPAVTRPAKEATKTIPIVMAQDDDPVGNGFVASLARPGGNITGLSSLAPEISGKRLELLKEIIPQLTRVAALGTSATPGTAQGLRETELAAGASKIQIQYQDIKRLDDIEPAFRAASQWRAEAVLILGGPVLNSDRARVVNLAVKNRLPATYNVPDFVEAGGLMNYGVSFVDLYRRAAVYVDKILKGAKPSDLPVEQPKKFEFIINLKAAKQIGLTIPPNVLVRADRVIR